MARDPLTDVVADQYRTWVYPAPIEDLPSWLVSNWQWFDPSHAYRSMWPDRDYRPDTRILVAGCGTSQAAVLAYTNPSAQIVAIDVSESSLDHHRSLKVRYGLDNLDLQRLPIEEAGALPGDFDLIVSTGVLHHLEDPDEGARVLGGLLAPDGVLAVMLYARYGRIGVEMMQGVFRDLALRQDEASLAIVRQAIECLPANHPVRDYIASAPDLDFDAGLVDTFLHGRDRSYTVADCLDLVSSAGLVFQDWFLKAPYEPREGSGDAFLDAVAGLPDASRWSVMERVNSGLGRHFFLACRSERDEASYRIDWMAERRSEFVPAFRYRCRLDRDTVGGPGWTERLEPEQASILKHVDGKRTMSIIVDLASREQIFDTVSRIEVEDLAARTLERLWKSDLIAIGLGRFASNSAS